MCQHVPYSCRWNHIDLQGSTTGLQKESELTSSFRSVHHCMGYMWDQRRYSAEAFKTLGCMKYHKVHTILTREKLHAHLTLWVPDVYNHNYHIHVLSMFVVLHNLVKLLLTTTCSSFSPIQNVHTHCYCMT